MRKICIQSGHWGMTSGQTGAPREQERTIAIGLRLVQILSALGVETYRDDAFDDNDPKVNNTDWDLYLALHCDANYAGDEGGGFVDFIDPSIDSSPESNAESKRIKEAIENVYFKETGIRNVPSRSNPNTRFYYMWSALSPKTPCVIIEMGESVDPHDNVILNDTERVAKALAKSIQNAFPDLIPTAPVVDVCQSFKDQITILKNDNKEKETTIGNLNEQITTLKSEKNTLSEELRVCQDKVDANADCPNKLLEATNLLNQEKQDRAIEKGNWSIKEIEYEKKINTLNTRLSAFKSTSKKLLVDIWESILGKK